MLVLQWWPSFIVFVWRHLDVVQEGHKVLVYLGFKLEFFFS